MAGCCCATSAARFRDYAVAVEPGGTISKATRVLGTYLREVMRRSAEERDFRLVGPDETVSNRLEAVLEEKRAWMGERSPLDEGLSADGRVMEILSEHVCQGWLEGSSSSLRRVLLAVTDRGGLGVNLGDGHTEPQLATAIEILGDEVGDEVLLRVDRVHLAAAKLAVVQLEFATRVSKRARVVRASIAEHAGAEPVLGQHSDAIRAETRPSSGLHMLTTGTLGTSVSIPRARSRLPAPAPMARRPR